MSHQAPTQSELAEVLNKIIHRTAKHLEKRGLIVKDEEDHLQLDLTEDDALARLQAGAATYRFTLGPNKGKKALTLKTMPDTDHAAKHGLVAKSSGFSLHAGVAMAGTERDKIEKLCRYIARPAVALERLSLSSSGQVIYTLKKPYDDGTQAISLSPMELMERLAALVPRPKIHLTRFFGVFAPHYRYRAMVVPKLPEPAASAPSKREQPSKSRITWARLLKRVFGLDVETCQLCGGKMKVIAAIEDPQVIRKILEHLGLPTRPPTIWSARGPPSRTTDDDIQHFPISTSRNGISPDANGKPRPKQVSLAQSLMQKLVYTCPNTVTDPKIEPVQANPRAKIRPTILGPQPECPY
ncbi:MAG: transposase [Bdellovibrionales bacterium]|nr:transposase [Bdellovibrionales bacterium]